MDVIERDGEWFSDEFKSSLMLAIALHLFLFMIMFIAGRVLGGGLSEKATIEVIKASVRVDVVGMPKMTLQELKALEAPVEAPREEPKPAEATKVEDTEAPAKPDDLVMPEEKKEATKKSFSDMLNNYSSQKVKVDKKDQKGQKGAKPTGLDSLIIEGNRLSKGTALVGDSNDLANSAFVNYVQTLPEHVRQFWRLTKYYKEQNFRCKVRIWIGPRGELLKVSMYESSGNAEYDSIAENAIRAAAPYPKPTVDAAPQIGSRGVILGFPLAQ